MPRPTHHRSTNTSKQAALPRHPSQKGQSSSTHSRGGARPHSHGAPHGNGAPHGAPRSNSTPHGTSHTGRTHNHHKQNTRNAPTISWQADISINSKGTGYVAVPAHILKELRRTLSARDQKNAFVSRSRDNECEAEVQPHRLGSASHNDTVKVALAKPLMMNDRLQAEVESVTVRYRTHLVATVIRKRTCNADDKRINTPFTIDQDVPVGSKVYIKITSWEKSEASVIRIIGKAGDNRTEMLAAALDKGFSDEHPAAVVAEAEKAATMARPVPQEEIALRRDFRSILTFTIDPADAKDFDDAISIRPIAGTKDRYEIGVHIADVSHFVRPGGALDKEALKRGCSVYLADRTIPMLPPVLADDVCSLNPHQDRLTFSAVFEMDLNGHVYSRWIGKTIIHSAKRFSYEEAQESISANAGPYANELRILNTIAKKLAAERFRRGSIDFDKDEVKFELDREGRPLRVVRKVRLDAHRLVEDFMLLANRAVAEFIHEKFNTNKKGGPSGMPARKEKNEPNAFIYRIHDAPDRERIIDLAIFAKALGYELEAHDGKVSSQAIRHFLDQVTGTPHEMLIKTATIRSMAKAVYSTRNIGHFGLAFEYYAHFTSPIRRYPDLLVHRVIDMVLRGEHIAPALFAHYQKMAEHSTEREILAAEAERGSIKYKQTEYMATRIGQEFVGTVSGVTEWGIYVEENDTKCEGMIRMRGLGDVVGDYMVFDEKNYTVRGERTSTKIQLGDTIRFKVVAADMEKRQLEYSFLSRA